MNQGTNTPEKDEILLKKWGIPDTFMELLIWEDYTTKELETFITIFSWAIFWIVSWYILESQEVWFVWTFLFIFWEKIFPNKWEKT
jgi:hypothetical protein